MRVLITLLALVTAPFLASVSQEPAGSPARTGNDAVRHSEAGNVEDQDNDDGDGHCWTGEHDAARESHSRGHGHHWAKGHAKHACDAPPPPAPVANFTSSCSGLTCSFDASSSTAQASATYDWSWGDATTGTGKTATHAYAAAGTYSVTLTVSDAGGSSTKTQPAPVTAPPSTTCTIGTGGMGEIDGMSWWDVNGNTWQDNLVSEPGQAGWTIELSCGGAVVASKVTGDGTTAPLGTYAFTGLTEGTYLVCEVPQAGWRQSAPVTARPCAPFPPATTGYGYTVVVPPGLVAPVTSLANDFGNTTLP